MGEKEPKPIRFFVEIEGTKLECTPDNTSAFLHKEEADKRYDHIWFVTEQEDGESRGYYLWREFLPNFDELIAFMYKNGYDLARKGKPTEMDADNYHEMFADEDEEWPELPELGATALKEFERDLRYIEYMANKNENDW